MILQNIISERRQHKRSHHILYGFIYLAGYGHMLSIVPANPEVEMGEYLSPRISGQPGQHKQDPITVGGCQGIGERGN